MLLRVFLLSFSSIGAKAVTCIEQMVSGTDKGTDVASGTQPALVAS